MKTNLYVQAGMPKYHVSPISDAKKGSTNDAHAERFKKLLYFLRTFYWKVAKL